ncbi:lantibiotic dehydratase [Micromonospora sp. NPDC048830]|uniref:lantibiotic dehydratase n=1 Tax=Micromonospora sp. NPDC048830 TaxID=3364257 RepID=UPI003718BE07
METAAAELKRPEVAASADDVRSGWSLVPVALLRQAGFPLSLLDRLVDAPAVRRAEALLDRRDATRRLAGQVKAVLRAAGAGTGGDLASGVGMLRPFSEPELARLRAALTAPELRVVESYQEAADDLDRAWTGLDSCVTEGLASSRRAVVELFADPMLREVLLLSNDARFGDFSTWLDRGATGSPGHVRRMTDLLTMYLQRVTAKNETHSHFGPLSVARLDPDATGVSWSTGPLRRVAFLSHWAGERLAEVFSAQPAAFEFVRPRRRPLAFVTGSRLALYAFRTTTGMPDDWRFVAVASAELDADQLWLWHHCDGDRTVAELRAAWRRRDPAVTRDLDEVLRELVDRDWLVGRWEIPIGSPDPLGVLAAQLRGLASEGHEVGARGLAVVRRFRTALDDFAAAAPADRPAALAAVKDDFETVAGTSANRGSGTHYADRSVLYEEAYGRVRGLRIGTDVAELISHELSLVYEIALLGPRLRILRERELLARWVRERFGSGVEVPLDRFYADFHAHGGALRDDCLLVDREIDAAYGAVLETLLDGWTGTEPEVVVDRERVERVLARYPAELPALCNPDVMLAAPDAAALARGDFLAVVGDCHALREVLTHSSFAPLIQAEAPELLDEVHTRYLDLLDDGEVLVDLARAHPDKTGAQLVYPCPDLEVYGRSPKDRDLVVRPGQLVVVADRDRLELRVRGTGRRIRLMAPLAGGPSIRQDPLSPFSFPRHFGGLGLRTDRRRLPRIRYGRVVLQRARRRIPAREFRGWSPGVRPAGGDAAEFAGAQSLRRSLGLPRTGFVKVRGEPKPVYVDWSSPLLVRQLFRLVRGVDSDVEFSEMLPDRDGLWLEVDGEKYTSELRCAVFSRRGMPAR